jgi:hypothetical protein
VHVKVGEDSRDFQYIDKGYIRATKAQINNPNLATKLYYDEKTGTAWIKQLQLNQTMLDNLTNSLSLGDKFRENMNIMMEKGLAPNPYLELTPGIIQKMTQSADFQAWKTAVYDAFTQWKKLATGLAAPKTEMADMEAALPTVEDKDPKVFKEKTLATIAILDRANKIWLDNLENMGYDVTALRQGIPYSNNSDSSGGLINLEVNGKPFKVDPNRVAKE